ncbi:hypothetical protein PG997_010787 [Apiospora hydei]|uniref:Uncharacterized protein n=1 Tax=Apiospora hydei TaxID=1337664 RepID=A0ABR1VH87_9PEZI
MILRSSEDQAVFLMVTTNPCQDLAAYRDNQDEVSPGRPIVEPLRRLMPPVNTTSCPQLNLPGVTTLPGYHSVIAAVCFSYPSIQHYKGSITNGILKEEIVGDPHPLSPFDSSDTLGGMVSEGLWNYGFSDHCLINNVLYTNASSNLSSVPGGFVTIGNFEAPKRCFYGFNSNWHIPLNNGGARNGLSDLITGGFSDDTCHGSNNLTNMVCDHAWWLGNMFNGGNAIIRSINAFLDAGFRSFTNQLRTYGTDWHNNNLVANGTVMETTVCTQFNWVWLVYPLAILVGTLVLFIATFISSSGMFGHVKETIWKSSVLPLLFYGLEAQHKRDGIRLATANELTAVAKRLKVDFSARDGGWRFHAVDGESADGRPQEESELEERGNQL